MREDRSEAVIRILVADDTRLHTQLLADALRRDGPFEVIASDSQELLVRADLHNIDVLLLSCDLDEQPESGFHILREIRARQPGLRAVMLLDSSRSALVLEAFRYGARGVLSRQDPIETLSKCLRRVHQGQIWADSSQMALLVQELSSGPSHPALSVRGMPQLSRREVEIITCVAQGLTNRKIAEHLSLSQHTVKNYLFKIFDKLGVSNRVELLSMTLGRADQSEPAGELEKTESGGSGLAECRRAAEKGIVNAQLKLARFYWMHRSDPVNMVQAYKWHLIASQQLSSNTEKMGSVMSIEQMLEAEKMAAEWLKKVQKGASKSQAVPPVRDRREQGSFQSAPASWTHEPKTNVRPV